MPALLTGQFPLQPDRETPRGEGNESRRTGCFPIYREAAGEPQTCDLPFTQILLHLKTCLLLWPSVLSRKMHIFGWGWHMHILFITMHKICKYYRCWSQVFGALCTYNVPSSVPVRTPLSFPVSTVSAQSLKAKMPQCKWTTNQKQWVYIGSGSNTWQNRWYSCLGLQPINSGFPTPHPPTMSAHSSVWQLLIKNRRNSSGEAHWLSCIVFIRWWKKGQRVNESTSCGVVCHTI